MTLVGEEHRVRVLGVPVDVLDMPSTLAWVERRVHDQRPGVHLCVNAANVVRAQEDPDYRALLERCDVVGADGQPFVWAARLLGQRLPERVTGIDLMEQVLDRARAEDWGVFLLGARPRVVERLADRLTEQGIRVVGSLDGYFPWSEAPEVAEKIASSGADILFVGMPTPVKEEFVVGYGAPAGVSACIGVGGSFDILAGELVRAPRFVQRVGLEWLFRLAQEPRRLFARYAITNSRFCALVVQAAVRRRRQLRFR